MAGRGFAFLGRRGDSLRPGWPITSHAPRRRARSRPTNQLTADRNPSLDRARIAHLRRHLFSAAARRCARFENAAGQRLFAIDMLLVPDRHHRRDCMGMIGRAHHYCVDFVDHLIEHLAEIAELTGLRIRRERFARPLFIGIAQRDDIFAETGD